MASTAAVAVGQSWRAAMGEGNSVGCCGGATRFGRHSIEDVLDDWSHFIRSEPVRTGAVEVIEGPEASSKLKALRSWLSGGRASGWPSETLAVAARTVDYPGHGAAGLDVLESMVGPGAICIALRSDAGRDRIARGPAPRMVGALEDSPFMEFIVFSDDLSWAVIDTHHNVFLVVGEPPGAGSPGCAP